MSIFKPGDVVRCCTCGGSNVEMAVWVDPNSAELPVDKLGRGGEGDGEHFRAAIVYTAEPLIDFGEESVAGPGIATSWCHACNAHVHLTTTLTDTEQACLENTDGVLIHEDYEVHHDEGDVWVKTWTRVHKGAAR